MRVNTDPTSTPRLPNILELAQLKNTLLPDALVQLVPLDELERRAQEINITHPHFQEETPLVVKWERQRRQRLSGGVLVLAAKRVQVA